MPSVPNYLGPKLGARNFNAFYADFRAHLRRAGLWRYVEPDGSISPPLPPDASSTAEERAAWDKHLIARDQASGEIFLALEDAQKVHVTDVDGNPVAMWEKLRRVHQQQKPAARFSAYDVLLNLRKGGEETLSALLARADKCQQDIRALRPPAFTLERLDEELICMALIRSLGPDYNAFVSSLLLQASGTLTLAALQSAFHNEESQRESRAAIDAPAIQLAHAASTSRCSFCDIPGHGQGDCRKYARALADARDRSFRPRRQRRDGEQVPVASNHVPTTANQAEANVQLNT